MRLQLNKIAPRHTPGTRAGKLAIFLAQKPLGMIFLKRTTPTGVVDDEIEKQTPAACVYRIGQLAKLLHAGGAFVKFDQGGVDVREIATGIGTAKTPHARVRRGCGIDGQ